MADELLTYYEQELSFLRQMGADFASQYPKIASRLMLEPNRCEDPHVERLIQSFALIAARIRHKLDDEFPEITDALLNVLYPHYLAPLPSFSIVKFKLDPERGNLQAGHRIERETTLYSAKAGGAACRFRSCYPVTLWPLEVVSAGIDAPDRLNAPRNAAAAIRIQLRCTGGARFSELQLNSLRFFLNGEGPLVCGLYESIFSNVCQVQVRDIGDEPGSRRVVLQPSCVSAVGFAPDEGILPYTARSFMGYRLLQEYFAYREKFLFFDILQLDRAVDAGLGSNLEILLLLDRAPRLEQPIRSDTFQLGCAPIINLFAQAAEPIRLDRTRTEYRVIPDVRHQTTTEVYSVNSVSSVSPLDSESVDFEPFYSLRHTVGAQASAFWYATRRPSPRKGDAGTDVHLVLVDLNFRPTRPSIDALTIQTTCTNRDLPGQLPFGRGLGANGDFQIDGDAVLSSIECLKKPTETQRAPLGRGAHWRLLSHLSLNYLSICEGGKEALQEILQLYHFWDSAEIQQQIKGIAEVRSRRTVGRPVSMPWNGFCRGLEVTIEFDETKFVGSSIYLFASVLERFLGLYASLNSFSQLVATTKQREEPLKRWPPRAGDQILL
jgi:type VI secretion system protein ImpG